MRRFRLASLALPNILLQAAVALGDPCVDPLTFTGATGGERIQNAINSCTAAGCEVCISSLGPDIFGVWLVASPITLKNREVLRGQGWSAVLSKYGPPA